MEKTAKKEKTTKEKKSQTKKSKFVLAWEKMAPNSLEIIGQFYCSTRIAIIV